MTSSVRIARRRDRTRALKLAISAGTEAGRLTLQYFQQDNYEVERKSDASPVTIADRSAEQLLRERIAAAFPQDGIIGEEFGTTTGTSGFRWILDPIDGTKSFIHGVPLYGTLIGVEHEGRASPGVIYHAGARRRRLCVGRAGGLALSRTIAADAGARFHAKRS